MISGRRLVVVFLSGLMLLPAGMAWAQKASVQQIAQIPHGPPTDPVEDETRRRFEHDREKKASEERYQKVKDDTERLVELSNQLKEYVGKANEHTLSLDVIKKAEEIERLAKSVKDKMRAN